MTSNNTCQIPLLLLPFAIGFCKDTKSQPTALLAQTALATDLVKYDSPDAVSLLPRRRHPYYIAPGLFQTGWTYHLL